MTLVESILAKLGAMIDRTHLFNFKKPAAKGVQSLFTQDLRPIGATVMHAGNLVELWCILDDHAPLTAGSRVRFDVLEEDFLLTGGLDDQVISLLGTDAEQPESGFTIEQRETLFHELDPGVNVPAYIEEYRRRLSSPQFDRTILVLVEKGVEDGRPAGTRRSHVITWWRTKQVEDLDSESEIYFVVNIDGTIRAGSPILRTQPAVPGVAVRVIGNLVDATPFDVATPEPLPDIPVSLGGRRALSGSNGDFVIDARLAVGEHRLELKRPGIDTLTVTVRVALNATGHATVNIVDTLGKNLFSVSTPAPATEDTLVMARLGTALKVLVHKIRGRVLWPDSLPGGREYVGEVAEYPPMPEAYLGTPLAERHVYVWPIPPGRSLTHYRPKTTRDWEALKAQPGVLQSSRPGAPVAKQRTDFNGRFEVKYVDFSAGSRYLLWVERYDPQSASGVIPEVPDHVVRSEQKELIEIHETTLEAKGSQPNTLPNAADLLRRRRNLVDRQRNLSRDVVSWGVDAMRVVDRNNVRTLVRPDRTLLRPNRTLQEAFDDSDLAADGESHEVPASRLVDNLIIQVLPLAPIDEPANVQGAAARRLRLALEQAASAAYPDGADLDDVRLVLDVGQGVDRMLDAARKVELLEQTLIVRPGHDLNEARWHIDAVSLADAALVSIDPRDPFVGSRRLEALVVPVLGVITPKLPALMGKRLYLGPGHGLWPNLGKQNSAQGRDWISNRGGWQLNAGEDEIDALQSAEINRIVKLAGMEVVASRQIEDFVHLGVANTGPNQWQPQGGDFPRLWQQNDIYYLGLNHHPVVRNNQSYRSPVGNKNNHGIDARVKHLVAEANVLPFDIVLFTHTNAGGWGGTLMEYLNIAVSDRRLDQGNKLGFEFAERLYARVVERCHVQTYNGGGVLTMLAVNPPEIDGDLVNTNDHWELQANGDNPVTRRRVRRVLDPAPANTNWVHNAFEFEFPVVVSELLFHDVADDARLLSRAWFRRLAAEAMSLAIQDQVRDNPAVPLTADQRSAVLTGMFGSIPPVGAAGMSVANLVDAALTYARSYTRQNLVDALKAELRTIAGYADVDDLASTIAAVLQRGEALARPTEPPTRAEAGMFACLAVGLTPASLATAETQRIGTANQPLVRPTAKRQPSAYFPRAEEEALASALRALRPTDIYKVADVFFADAGWQRTSRFGQPNRYEFDLGTPVLLVVETDGFPWKGTTTDVSFVLAGGGKQKILACKTRQPRRLVSSTWFVDWPATDKAVELTITVRVQHRNQQGVVDWKVLGTKILELQVVVPLAERPAP